MGARWQSSQRPLFVRTVWVNGRRHAILSRDDPLLRFPRPSSSTSPSDSGSEASTCCQLEDCLIKLRLALQPETYQGTFQESIYPIRHGTVEASHCYSHDDSDSCFEEEVVPTQRLPLLGQYPKVYSFEPSEHPPLLPDLQLNPLSERVLQWLDLSGKGKRLGTSISLPRESKSSREERESAKEARKPHVSKRRELQARSLSMDVTDIKLTTRSAGATLETIAPVKRKKPITLVVAAKSSLDHCHEEHHVRRSPEEPPVIQTFEPPRLLRPVTAWPSTTAPNRPQLHIFMPPLAHEMKQEEVVENESNIEEPS